MIKKNFKKIFICATEQSGDNIGKNIIQQLKKEYSYVIFDGVGGANMKSFMRNQFYSLKEFKSIGIVEVIFSIKKYINIINKLSKIIIKEKYDLIITIDSPDFNYPLSKKIKKFGFKGKIIQIVAPTVWAWRKNRAKKFSMIFDEIFTLFHFENKYFTKHNLKTTCIGHPIFHIKKILNKNVNKNYIAFLPGSRLGEINSLFPFFDLAHNELIKMKSKYKIFIPTLPHLKKEVIYRTKLWKIPTEVTTDFSKIETYFLKTKLALVCSGTASIEIAKRGIPQFVIYKLNYFTELIASLFVSIKFANIINIIANKMIIPELTNSNLKKNIFIKRFNKLVLDDKSNNLQVKKVEKIVKLIEKNKSPYKIASKQIKKYL